MPLTDGMAHQQHSPLPPPTNGLHDVLVTNVVAPPFTTAEDGTASSLDSPVPHHPLGVRPLGNKYLASGPDAKAASGAFQTLPDELVMQTMEWLDAPSLAALGYTCKFLYAFCDYDELWKNLVLGAGGLLQEWRGTWRESLMANGAQSRRSESHGIHIDCRNVFSDVLHRPFLCSHVSPRRFASNIPKVNQIRRFSSLGYDEFADKWSNTPFILTECVRKWPVLADWSLDKLREAHATTLFRAESVDWPYALYDQYLCNTTDESPLYLFDRKFAEKMKIRVGQDASSSKGDEGVAYWKPDCFGPDLFEVLGAERPAHRWLIIGPARSGSTFHKDPNGTSAWNAVVQGAKYWIMFPPSVAVPGVFVSRDKSEVTSPLSIAEWLLAFHAEARRQPGCIEGVCQRGEILHVPSGWWHLVVNLEPGIALTQNFVSKTHLADVLLFLRDRPEQVTGFARDAVMDPYGLFVERLSGSEHADELQTAQAEIARRDARRKRTWQAIVGRETKSNSSGGGSGYDKEEADIKNARGQEKRQCTDSAGGFTFAFAGEDDDLEDEIP